MWNIYAFFLNAFWGISALLSILWNSLRLLLRYSSLWYNLLETRTLKKAHNYSRQSSIHKRNFTFVSYKETSCLLLACWLAGWLICSLFTRLGVVNESSRVEPSRASNRTVYMHFEVTKKPHNGFVQEKENLNQHSCVKMSIPEEIYCHLSSLPAGNKSSNILYLHSWKRKVNITKHTFAPFFWLCAVAVLCQLE